MRLSIAETTSDETSQRVSVANPTTDTRLADQVIEKISAETFQVFDQLKAGMVDEASFKTVEANVARNYIIATLAEIRGEAYRDSAVSARRFAELCGRASDQLTSTHQRLVAQCIAALFEQFAERLEQDKLYGVQPAGGPAEADEVSRDEAS